METLQKKNNKLESRDVGALKKRELSEKNVNLKACRNLFTLLNATLSNSDSSLLNHPGEA